MHSRCLFNDQGTSVSGVVNGNNKAKQIGRSQKKTCYSKSTLVLVMVKSTVSRNELLLEDTEVTLPVGLVSWPRVTPPGLFEVELALARPRVGGGGFFAPPAAALGVFPLGGRSAELVRPLGVRPSLGGGGGGGGSSAAAAPLLRRDRALLPFGDLGASGDVAVFFSLDGGGAFFFTCMPHVSTGGGGVDISKAPSDSLSVSASSLGAS